LKNISKTKKEEKMTNLYEMERSRPEIQKSDEFKEYLAFSREYIELRQRYSSIQYLWKYEEEEFNRIMDANKSTLPKDQDIWSIKFLERIGVNVPQNPSQTVKDALAKFLLIPTEQTKSMQKHWQRLKQEDDRKLLIFTETKKNYDLLIEKREKLKQSFKRSLEEIVGEIMECDYQKRAYCVGNWKEDAKTFNKIETWTIDSKKKEKIKSELLNFF